LFSSSSGFCLFWLLRFIWLFLFVFFGFALQIVGRCLALVALLCCRGGEYNALPERQTNKPYKGDYAKTAEKTNKG
jgi:hypothetical protein